MPLAAIDLGVSQGAAVLGLLERASVPPFPTFYKLLYDYVADVGGLLASRIDDIIADGGEVGDRLYAEFIAPYETHGAVATAIARITARLQTVELLINDGAMAARMQSATLRGASATFAAQRLDAALLRDWVARLEATNRNLLRAHTALERELLEASAEIEATRHEIRRSRESLGRDPLTGLYNRSGVAVELQRLQTVRRETGRGFCCLVVDIDHFKSLNDRYGHQAGDEVLRIVARAMLASVRGSDLVSRPGGDEFLVVLPDAELEVARDVAHAIRRTIAESDLRGVFGADVLGGITASIGGAQIEGGETVAGLVKRADRCLYEAKGAGRNRVVFDLELAAA